MSAAEPIPHPPGAALCAEGLCKRFGGLVAVDGLSLQVRSGEIFGLLGPNGAGKTTAIGMMTGLLRPDAGRTTILGMPVDAGDDGVRSRVGVCPQQIVIWPRLTCMEQLVFMGEAYDVPRGIAARRADELLSALGLQEKRDRLARTLSGGMQRRLSIALALVHEPDVVVLDEPEAGLDPQSRVLVREYVASLARGRGKTILFTTHNMDEAERVTDRVAIVDRGKLLELDTPDALRRRVGGGDTLELALSQDGKILSEESIRGLREALPGAQVDARGLVLRRRAIVEELPAILDLVRRLGLAAGRVQLRESTLEDVFLALTGRSLRE